MSFLSFNLPSHLLFYLLQDCDTDYFRQTPIVWVCLLSVVFLFFYTVLDFGPLGEIYLLFAARHALT